jgi:hypothetical protein
MGDEINLDPYGFQNVRTATWAGIDPRGSWLAIGAAKSEHGLCLQIPGCNLKDDGIWRVPLTWPAYVAFKAVWSSQPITEHPQLLSWAAGKWREVQDRYTSRMAMDATDPEVLSELISLDGAGGLQLDGIQRGHVNWLVRWRRVILGDPMGNGKTPPLIRALQLLGPEACPALVICPDSAPRSWARKVATWAPQLRVQVVLGTALARRKALETPADIYIIPWPNLRYHTRLAAYPSQRMVTCPEHGGVDPKITPARCEVHAKELNGLGIKTVIADECHRMADPKAKQTRAAQWMAHHAENFWAVTGTLTAADVGDLWAVLHAIDPKAWPARTRYTDLYAEVVHEWHGGSETLGLRPDTEPYFHTAVDPCFRRIPIRTGRPERLEPEFRYPEMSGAQSRAYTQLTKELLADLTGQQMVPDNDAVRFGRLVQLASSAVELDDGEDGHGFTKQKVRLALPSNKADDLLEFLADNEGQWIVTCFSPDLAELCARKLDAAHIPHTKIIGGMSSDAKDQAAQLFQNNDRIRVIFLTAAGSESIDLQAARGVVFLQPNPSFVAREQIIGRADRRGQTRPVRTVYMISPVPVDNRLYDLGCEKEERHSQVTRDAALMRWVIEQGELAGT